MNIRPALSRRALRGVVCSAFLLSCGALGQGWDELHRHFPVSDPKNFKTVIATVGDIDITAQEFLLSYEFGPSFPKRRKDSRKTFLDFMINEKLLALDAAAKGLSDAALVTRSLQELEGDMATEELFKDDVMPLVHVSAAELNEGVRDERTHYALRWIYTPEERDAQQIERQLRQGVSFDSLYQRQMHPPVKSDDRSLESTRFKLRRANALFARVVDSLRVRRPSHPLRAPDGYYIVSLDSSWRDVLITGSEGAKLMGDARQILEQEKSDSISSRYVRRIMLENNPVIVRRTFDKLQAYLGSLWADPDRYASWDLTKRFRDEGDSVDVKRIDDYGEDTLVTLKRKGVSLKEFLVWYRARDTYFRLNTTSRPAFFLSVEDLVWRMVRDKLLIARAYKRKLQDRDIVKRQMKWWKDKVLFGIEKRTLEGTITLSDSLCRSYYGEHTRDYLDTALVAQPYERVQEQVRKDCYELELQKRLLHTVLALKRKYPVRVHEDLLNSLPVDQENEPRAIDVYTVKKGGTFPHPAFPTIDYDWQKWM